MWKCNYDNEHHDHHESWRASSDDEVEGFHIPFWHLPFQLPSCWASPVRRTVPLSTFLHLQCLHHEMDGQLLKHVEHPSGVGRGFLPKNSSHSQTSLKKCPTYSSSARLMVSIHVFWDVGSLWFRTVTVCKHPTMSPTSQFGSLKVSPPQENI